MNHGAPGYRSLCLRDLLLGTHRFDSLRNDGAFKARLFPCPLCAALTTLIADTRGFYGRTRWLDCQEDLTDANMGVELDRQDEKVKISERLGYISLRSIR